MAKKKKLPAKKTETHEKGKDKKKKRLKKDKM